MAILMDLAEQNFQLLCEYFEDRLAAGLLSADSSEAYATYEVMDGANHSTRPSYKDEVIVCHLNQDLGWDAVIRHHARA